MAKQREKSLPAGALVGMVGGVVASAVMLQFVEVLGPKLLSRMEESDDQRKIHQVGLGRSAAVGRPGESVTMKAAEAAMSRAVGRHLTLAGRKQGGAVLHYGFGMVMGALYGSVAEYLPVETVGFGAVFGTVLWAGTDLLAVPAVGLAKWPTEETGAAHLTHWMAHVIYGVTMEGLRRALRIELD